MHSSTLFAEMVGSWEGTCRTWFKPDEMADESIIRGEIAYVYDRLSLRHVYEGTIQGKKRQGEELIAFNSQTALYQTSWIDDFHMNYAIMFSQGKGTASGFTVLGEYDVGPEQPRWGWRTEFAIPRENSLTVTAYNITPEGIEAKAVETIYRRVDSE